jgi:phage shock protein A
MAIFARLGRLLRGFLGLFIGGIEERNPEALMEAGQQEFRDRMTQYNQALAQMAGIAERLKSQIKMKATRAQDLERRILTNHRAGNLELAGSLARELQELKADLTTDTQELAETEEAYQANLRQARVTRKEFEDKISRLRRQLSEVRIKEAQAEAAGALNNVAFRVGDLGDTMKTVEEVLARPASPRTWWTSIAWPRRKRSARPWSRRRWPSFWPVRASRLRRRPSPRRP